MEQLRLKCMAQKEILTLTQCLEGEETKKQATVRDNGTHRKPLQKMTAACACPRTWLYVE